MSTFRTLAIIKGEQESSWLATIVYDLPNEFPVDPVKNTHTGEVNIFPHVDLAFPMVVDHLWDSLNLAVYMFSFVLYI